MVTTKEIVKIAMRRYAKNYHENEIKKLKGDTSTNSMKPFSVQYDMDIKEEIYNFISTHEAQVATDMEDDMVSVKFTTFGNRAGRRALYDVIKMLDEDTKLKVVEMMRNKRVEYKTSTIN